MKVTNDVNKKEYVNIMTILLDNVDTNTTSPPESFNGGPKVMNVRGDDFGGGTVSIEQRSKNDTGGRFSSLATFDSNGTKILADALQELEFRAVLAGATNAVNVFAEIIPE